MIKGEAGNPSLFTKFGLTWLWAMHNNELIRISNKTDKDSNKVLFSFYNSDMFSKSLRVTVKGITKDGRLTYYQQVIE